MSTGGICRSCSARIFWAVTDAGKTIPLDAAPSENGNLSVFRDATGQRRCRHVKPGQAKGMRLAGQPTYTAHFASCPQASVWRNKHKQKRG